MMDGQLIAAAEEERFTRIKHDYEFPDNAIRFCLETGGISADDLDYVVFFEKPFIKFERILQTTLSGFPRTYPLFVQSLRTWLFDKLWVRSTIMSQLGIPKNKVLFSEHHLSHAASAYFASPFNESAVLTFDGVGEWATTALSIGEGNQLQTIKEIHFPHSIGLLYSAMTAFLGFEVNEGEYKVMGMAPYGTPRYTDQISRIVKQRQDGSFWLDLEYFSFHRSTVRSFTNKMIDLLGPARDPETPFFTDATGYPEYYGERPANYEELVVENQHYADIAASIQSVTEDLILNLAIAAHDQTGQKHLCLAGGVALNSVANSRILNETPFEDIYIQPSSGDGGGALGACLLAWNSMLGSEKRIVMDHAYWGSSYSQDIINTAISSSGHTAVYHDDEEVLINQVCDRLEEGKVIGWFQGRAEWGPRALGNRSILADPRRSDMKDIVNAKIKFREPFRPFAPSVLAEKCDEFFELPNAYNSLAARFMLLVVPVRPDKEDVVPAVSHMGTSRVQTVHKETNPRYHRLIERFGERTNVPVLMNTSFNVRGEPIVNSPTDAIRTFNNSGLDSLVLGSYLIDKEILK